MNVSQTGIAYSVQNIEVSSLFMLFSEVENSVFDRSQLLEIQPEYYQEISQDAA